MPGGEAWYRQQIREYTTLDLDPDEIHAIGLREVDGIQREMDAIIREVGFDGDFADFLHFLRTDPQFYARTPEELLRRAAWIAKRVDGEIADVIGPLPRGERKSVGSGKRVSGRVGMGGCSNLKNKNCKDKKRE